MVILIFVTTELLDDIVLEVSTLSLCKRKFSYNTLAEVLAV